MSTAGSQRDRSLDIAKGIGMICVIAGHMRMQYFNQVVYTFHMPLFLVISGYLLKEDRSIAFLRKKAKALLVPYVLTSLFMMCFNLLFPSVPLKVVNQEHGFLNIVLYWLRAIVYASGSNTDYFGHFIPFIGEIWFLVSLFSALCIVNFIGTRRYGTVFVAVLAFIGWYTARITWLPFSLQSAMVSALFMQCGYLVKNYKLRETLKGRYYSLAGLALWAVSLGLTFYTRTHMSMVRCEFPHGLLDITGALGASLVILNLSDGLYRRQKDSKAIAFLIFFGSGSLLAMCVHYVDACILPIQQIYDRFMPAGKAAALLFVLLFLCLRIAYTSLGMRIIMQIKTIGKQKQVD